MWKGCFISLYFSLDSITHREQCRAGGKQILWEKTSGSAVSETVDYFYKFCSAEFEVLWYFGKFSLTLRAKYLKSEPWCFVCIKWMTAPSFQNYWSLGVHTQYWTKTTCITNLKSFEVYRSAIFHCENEKKHQVQKTGTNAKHSYLEGKIKH